jgi:HSP20 family protein
MNLVRFQPWSVADLIQRDFNRPNTPCLNGDYGQTPSANWVPAVDIIEEKDSFVLRADLPGVTPEHIEVSMDDGVLDVAGERRIEGQEDSDGLRRIERVSGRFHRRFSLPETADAERIAAKSTNGILEVTIPKLPEVQPRRVTVEAA